MPRIAAACALVLLLAASPAQAKLRDLGPFSGSPVTNGSGYLVGSRVVDGTVEVVAPATGVRLRHPIPAGCAPQGPATGGVVLDCYATGEPLATGWVLDPATGRLEPLPEIGFDRLREDLAVYVAAGRRWARFVASGYHYGYDVFVDRATGALRRGPDEDRRRTVDLDRPGLVRRLCRPLRRPLQTDEASGVGLVFGPLEVHRGAAAAVTEFRDGSATGRLVLQRCGRRPKVVRDCRRVSCSDVVFDGRTLAWLEYRRRGGMRPPATVRVMSVRSGRRRSFTRPGVWDLELVDGRLLAVVGGTRLVEISRGP